MIGIHLLAIFLASILTHNIALTYLLGMCPFVSLSRNLRTASGMGFAVIFVVVLTAMINWPIYHLVSGEASLAEASSEAFLIFLGSTITGFAWGTLYLKTDSLWASYLAHTINNTVLNLVHVQTTASLDPDFFVTMMVVAIGNLALVPWTIYWAKRRNLPQVKTWGEPQAP